MDACYDFFACLSNHFIPPFTLLCLEQEQKQGEQKPWQSLNPKKFVGNDSDESAMKETRNKKQEVFYTRIVTEHTE